MKLFRGDPRAARMAELEAENRELRAKIARVREVADDLKSVGDLEMPAREPAALIRSALDGGRTVIHDDDALDALRVAKRKHTPEAALQALTDAGWMLIPAAPVEQQQDGWRRFDGLVDNVFASDTGVVDVGLYDDMTAPEVESLVRAILSAVRAIQEGV